MKPDSERRGRATPSAGNLSLCLLLPCLALGSCRGSPSKRDPASRFAEAAERLLMQKEDARQVAEGGAEKLDDETLGIIMRAQNARLMKARADNLDREAFAACMRILDPEYRFVLARSEAERTRVLCNAIFVSKRADLKTLFHWARDPRPLVQGRAFGAIGVAIVNGTKEERDSICDELLAYLAEDLPPAYIARALWHATFLSPGREVPEAVVANLARKARIQHYESRYLAAAVRLIREGGSRLPSSRDLAEYAPGDSLTPTTGAPR